MALLTVVFVCLLIGALLWLKARFVDLNVPGTLSPSDMSLPCPSPLVFPQVQLIPVEITRNRMKIDDIGGFVISRAESVAPPLGRLTVSPLVCFISSDRLLTELPIPSVQLGPDRDETRVRPFPSFLTLLASRTSLPRPTLPSSRAAVASSATTWPWSSSTPAATAPFGSPIFARPPGRCPRAWSTLYVHAHCSSPSSISALLAMQHHQLGQREARRSWGWRGVPLRRLARWPVRASRVRAPPSNPDS